jgi:hypothetical protein
MVHSLTLFCTLGSIRCDSQAPLLTCNFANACLGREPKAKVATLLLKLIFCILETSDQIFFFVLFIMFIVGLLGFFCGCFLLLL